jgi:hypothetical protein
MDPMMLGLQTLLGGLGSMTQQPQAAASPSTFDTASIMAMMPKNPTLGSALTSTLAGTENPAMPGMSMVDNASMPAEAGMTAPAVAATAPLSTGQSIAQAVQAPAAPTAPMSGGVSGAQRVPETGAVKGSNMTALLQALASQQAPGNNVASLGALLGSLR